MWAHARLAANTMMLALFTASACPYPPQFPESEPTPNRPPVVVAAETDPFSAGGALVVGTRPLLTIGLLEFDPEDRVVVKVIKDLHVSMGGENQVPHQVLLDGVEIGPEDRPADADPGDTPPEALRSKQVELQMTPCPTGSAGTEPVLTVCLSDRGFVTYPDTLDPCQPRNRDTERDEERGYTTRYEIVYQCTSAP